uniref:60 kDa chaperonin (GroEL protein) (Protein Cpn60) n=1 Tax=Ganoderma boninense TaxID=34458 RepID=A0A5K1K3I7_9APHY|nr:60 kDa chaperonin (GroEL protein) (Protein Cpn60) [Ganoderma boninense]
MGLLTFLRNTLGIPKPPGTAPADAPPPNKRRPRIEIFGPRGTRRMLRMLWHITHSHSEFAYVVHELLFEGEQPSVAADVPPEREGADEADIRRESECVGRDIWCDGQGFWKGIVDMNAKQSHGLWGAVVDAGPIQHRDPCIGYIIREIPRYPLTVESPMPRKLVILGDTYDPSTIAPLIHADGPPSLPSSSEPSTSSSPTLDDPPFRTGPVTDFSVLPIVNPHDNGVHVRVPVSLLVHEATDAYLPPSVDPQQRTGKNRTPESVAEKAVLRGHSTPAMAGAFARTIAAGAARAEPYRRQVRRSLRFCSSFPAPDMEQNTYHRGHGGGRQQFRVACMREIERQAAAAWNPRRNMQRYVQAAWDFLTVSIPPNAPRAAMDVDVSVGMVDVAAAAAGPSGAGSSKGKARNYSTMAVDDVDSTGMLEDAGQFEKSTEMSVLEDEDEDGRGVALDPNADGWMVEDEEATIVGSSAPPVGVFVVLKVDITIGTGNPGQGIVLGEAAEAFHR